MSESTHKKQKYFIYIIKKCSRPPESDALCRNPGLNRGPLDLQSNALPTELFRPTKKHAVMSTLDINEDSTCINLTDIHIFNFKSIRF